MIRTAFSCFLFSIFFMGQVYSQEVHLGNSHFGDDGYMVIFFTTSKAKFYQSFDISLFVSDDGIEYKNITKDIIADFLKT